MKKIKGFIFAVGFVLCGFIAGFCVNTVEAGQKDFFKFKEVENDNHKGLSTYIMTDNKKIWNILLLPDGHTETDEVLRLHRD